MNVFYRMKKGTEYLNYGREIITDYCIKCTKDCEKSGNIRILDLGAGAGTDLQNCRKKLAGGGAEPVLNFGLWKVMPPTWNA